MLHKLTAPLAAAALLALAGSASAQSFPDGPGKEILEKKCSTCHAPEQVTTFGRSAEEWHEVVVNMIDLGAEVNEEETKILVEYLAKNWPLKGGDKPAEGDKSDKPAEGDKTDKPAEGDKTDKPAEKPSEEKKASPIAPVASHSTHRR